MANVRCAVAAALIGPGVLRGQDLAAAQLAEWRQRQIVIADSQSAARRASSKKDRDVLEGLEREMMRLRSDMRSLSRPTVSVGLSRRDFIATYGAPRTPQDPRPVYFNPEFLLVDHQIRGARVATDDSVAAKLDTAYRSGDPGQVSAALADRFRIVGKEQPIADSASLQFKELLTDAEEWRRWALQENHPDAEPAVKKALRAEIEQAGRVVRYLRGLTEFETRRGNLMRAERESLERQMSATGALQRSP